MNKNHIFIIIVLLFNQLHAANYDKDWLNNFIKAEEFVSQGNFELAISQYDLALNAAKDQLFLFVKRGRTFEKMKKYQEAFRDFDYVVNQHL